MGKELVWQVEAGSKIALKDYDPGYTGDYADDEAAKAEMKKLGKKLDRLQELMSIAQHHSVLLVLQGMDTSGKDGTIRHVFSRVDPQGCEVHAFKQPTELELRHDYLWRVHNVVPARGVLGIFNRSHYEDVLIVRVQKMVPEKVWSRRYKEINRFEELLADNNTIILKFFLHISLEEQEMRLLAREQQIEKAWKVSAGDWEQRKYWDDYMQAYEDALSQCSTKKAPWYVVPANNKWYRNLAIAHTLVKTLKQYEDEWQKELVQRGDVQLEGLRRMRAAQKSPEEHPSHKGHKDHHSQKERGEQNEGVETD